jgi:uncharacterized protein (TIGR01732 family)
MAYAAGAVGAGVGGFHTTTATILVLFILLTIISRVIGVY